jgi:hypothetical protein
VYLAYTQEITTGGAFDAKTVELDAQRGPQVNIHPSCRHGSSRATTEGLQLTREEALGERGRAERDARREQGERDHGA